MLVERRIIRILGTLSILGGGAFFLLHLWAIGGYLAGAGLLFWLFTWGWHYRFEKVLAAPPTGFVPTGETYWDPGRQRSVQVWSQGLTRVYVAESPDAGRLPGEPTSHR